MIELKKSEAREKILQAYKESLLSAQGPTPECEYRDSSGRPCAIGVLLDDKEGYELQGSVGMLVEEGLLSVDDPDWFQNVQDTHDSWCHARRYNPTVSNEEQAFVKALKS